MSVKTDEDGNCGSGVTIIETNRFGFILGNGETDSDAPCPESVRHRESKWLGLMKQWDQVMEIKSSRVKGQCQKGIPASVRAKCWPMLCGAMDRMKDNKSLYERLVEAPDQQGWTDIIKRDTDRQFPFHEMFQSKDSHGQKDLLHVLKAYTQYRPDEGYCQGQGPVAAVLLMNMPAEEAFWCLAQISEFYLPGYYSPLLEGVLFDAAVLSSVLKKLCPAAHKHLQNQGVEPLMFATDWLMCLYSRHLPFNTLLRVWDLFFCYGVRILFQVAVVLVRRCLGEGRQRKECDGQMETLERLRGVKAHVQNDQTDAFIHEVCSVPLSSADLQKQTEKEMKRWRKDRPDSTFDPRGRCHGYRMACERVQNKLTDNEKKERRKGTLPLPLMRSHSSLSPYALRKKWRKRGSRTEEWDGGGRKFSQGVMEESDEEEMRRRSACGVAGEKRAKQDRLAEELHTHKQRDQKTHANISLVVSSSTESDVFEMQSMTERDSRQQDKLHTHTDNNKDDTGRSLNQQKDHSSAGHDKCSEENIAGGVMEASIKTQHHTQNSETETCADQQNSEQQTNPDQQNSEKQINPDQQNSERETCADQQNSEQQTNPDQQNSETETCPDQQYSEKQANPDQQNSEKQANPDQQNSETETNPDQQNSEKQTNPDQQNSEQQTNPDQQNSETETNPDQQNSEKQTNPDQQNSEQQTNPDQQNSETETNPDQQNSEKQTNPDQQNSEQQTNPDQQNSETKKETIQKDDQNIEKHKHKNEQIVLIQITSELCEESISPDKTSKTTCDPHVEDSGKQEEEIQSDNYKEDDIQTGDCKRKGPETDALQKVTITKDNQQDETNIQNQENTPEEEQTDVDQENHRSYTLKEQLEERQEKEAMEIHATGEKHTDAAEEQAEFQQDLVSDVEIPEEREITQHSNEAETGSKKNRQETALERDLTEGRETSLTCEALLSSSSLETELESEAQGPDHPVQESQLSNPVHNETDVTGESGEPEHSQVEVIFRSGNPEQSKVSAAGDVDVPKPQEKNATVTSDISELNPGNNEVTALSETTKCSEFISPEELSNLENKEEADARISGKPESSEHVENELGNSGDKEQLKDGFGNEGNVIAVSGNLESKDTPVATELSHAEGDASESATGSDDPEGNAVDPIAGSSNLHNSTSAIPANSGELESAPSITPLKTPNIPPAQLCVRRTSSSRASYPTILSEDTFRVPKQMGTDPPHTAEQNTPKAEGSSSLSCHPEMNNTSKPDNTHSETHTQPNSQTKTRAPKRLGLFRRLRGDTNKTPIPQILVQDFSEKEERLTSKERRRRKREKERKEKEEKERKKREKEMEREKEKERKKPQTRGKSFQVLNRKCADNDVFPGNSDGQSTRSRRNSAPFSDSYF